MIEQIIPLISGTFFSLLGRCFTSLFSVSSLILEECGGCVLPGRKFWNPVRCDHWSFWVKCLSRHWKLMLRNGDGLGIGHLGGSQGGESKVFH